MFENDYLMHYGIKGQKWGVRRYQNADGSWTAAGRARYSKGGGKRAKYGFNIRTLLATNQAQNAMDAHMRAHHQAVNDALSATNFARNFATSVSLGSMGVPGYFGKKKDKPNVNTDADGSLTTAGRARYFKGGGKKRAKTRYGSKGTGTSDIPSDDNQIWTLKKTPKDYRRQVRDDWSSTVYYAKGDISPKLKKAALKRQLQLQKIYSKEGGWPSDFTDEDVSDYIIESLPDKKYRKAWNKMMYRDKQYSDNVYSTSKKGYATSLFDSRDYNDLIKKGRKNNDSEKVATWKNERDYFYPQYAGKKKRK